MLSISVISVSKKENDNRYRPPPRPAALYHNCPTLRP